MAFLVLEWDDADVEYLEGNLLTCQRHLCTAGTRQGHRQEVVGGPAAAAGDRCAWKTGESGALKPQWQAALCQARLERRFR